MRKRKLLSLLVAAMVMIGGSAWAGDKTVVSYSFDDVNSPAVTAGSRVSLDYTRTSVITSTNFLNAKEALQTAIAIATNINPEGLADAIAAAQAALTAEGATAESMAQAAQTLEAAIKTYFGEVLPNLGAIVTALNEETLNTAYADAQAALAKEDVTPQELVTAMQGIITAAQAVAPEHLQNLKGYAVKYGATDAATLVDNALAAIEAGNVAQIIATMTAVKEAATPLAQTVLGTMKNYVEAFGLTEQAAQAQGTLHSPDCCC